MGIITNILSLVAMKNPKVCLNLIIDLDRGWFSEIMVGLSKLIVGRGGIENFKFFDIIGRMKFSLEPT